MLTKILAIAWKEIQVLLKDRGNLAILFLLPLMLSTILGSMGITVSTSDNGSTSGEAVFNIFLVNEDTGPYGKQIASALHSIRALDVDKLPDVEQADQRVANGERMAAVIIPENFSADIDTYTPTELLMIIDPVLQQYAGIVTGIVNNVVSAVALQGEIRYGIRSVISESNAASEAPPEALQALEEQSFGVLMTQLMELNADPLITVKSEDIKGEKVETEWNAFNWTTPAFTVMFAFFLISVVGASLWAEKEDGSLRRLLAAPMHRGAFIAGKMLAFMLVVFMQVFVLFAVGTGIFNVTLGDPLGLLLITLPLAMASTSLGLMIAAFTSSRKQAEDTGTILGFILAGLGGCITPFFNQKGFMGIVTRFTPHAHALEGYVKIIIEGSNWIEILPQAGFLLGMGILFLLIAIWRFRYD
jgi:ABC-2 type transport system permease protein